jgi:hypothetical protein
MLDVTRPLPDATRTEVGGVVVEEVPAGIGRLKRVIYPVGWRWSTHMRPHTRQATELCEHGHVGFLVQGRMVAEYADGCRVDQIAPCAVVIEPGHDAWNAGDEPAVLLQFDCGPETVERLGLVGRHAHPPA